MLTPLGVGPGQPFPYISGLSLSLGVLARDPDTGEERFARVKVPEQLPRFVAVGGGRLLLPLEDVIGHYLDSLFPGMEIVERAVFRVTRDADMELSDDADDLLEAVQAEIPGGASATSCGSRWPRRCRPRWSSSSAAGCASATPRSTRSTACSTSPR